MPAKPTLLVGPVKIAKGKTVDPALAKNAEKVMLSTALKAFKNYNAVKSTREKEGFAYEPTLTTLALAGNTMTCEISSTAHPLSALKPLMKASNSGKMEGGSARDADDLVAAVIEAQCKKIESQLKKLK